MCHGHPHQHACSHTSIKWLYCPEAIFDLDTGYEEHCSNPIYSTIQPSNADCPLQHCYYKAVRGSWNCCKCGQGPNTLGWCTMPVQEAGRNDLTGEAQLIGEQCNHGCCKRCTRHLSSSRGSTPEKPYADIRKSSSRKNGSSKSSRSSTYDYSSGCPSVPEEEGDTTPSPPTERGARRTSYQNDIDYSSSKKSKAPSSSSSSSGSKKRSHHHQHHGHHSHHGHNSHHSHHKTRIASH